MIQPRKALAMCLKPNTGGDNSTKAPSTRW
jgi:hypothetical protein